MTFDDLTGWTDSTWAWLTGHPGLLTAAGVTAGLIVTAVLVAVTLVRLRRRSLSVKANVGFALVQAGVAYITITGVYEFFAHRLSMPWPEAALLAAFIEACVWAAVGFIYVHATGGGEGFGRAGGFFWFAVVGGGMLAVLGSDGLAVAFGRVIVVGLGAYMWYLRLCQKTNRRTTKSRWRWTPRALLLRLGAVTVDADDLDDDATEWTVRRLTSALRRADHKWRIVAWWGGRALTRMAEQTTPDILAAARLRRAHAYVLLEEASATSRSMGPVVAAVRAEWAGQPLAERDELIESAREIAREVLAERTFAEFERPADAPVPPSGDSAGQRRTAPDVPAAEVPALPAVPTPVPSPPPVDRPKPRPAGTRPGSADEVANRATEKWVADQITRTGNRPTLAAIAEHGAIDGKPRSENWARARRTAGERQAADRPRAVA